jgi:uncharacterized protein (DUF302 family)
MRELSFKKVVSGDTNTIITRVTEALKLQGFGILTRIDLDAKIKEKTGNIIEPVVILGACNPHLAYEAYQQNPEVTGLLPCNAVIRQLSPGKMSVELVRPSSLMEVLDDSKLVELSRGADERLQKVLESL